mgnify:CR=1 FL=1
MPKRILFFIDCLRSGGKERRLVELLYFLKRSTDFQMRLVLMDDKIHYGYVRELGIPIDVIERGRLRKDPSVFFRFLRIAREFRPDIIHSWGTMATFYAAPTKATLGCKLVANLIADSSKDFAERSLNSFFFRIDCLAADLILGNSEAGFKAYGVSGPKKRLIYNGVRLERFDGRREQEDMRRELGINTPYMIAMVASAIESKRYDLFVDVAADLLDLRKDVTFVGVGDGPEMPRILERIRSREADNVKMLGTRNDVEDIVAAADVGVLFTRAEGISNAIMEYMALGKPVVTTDRTGGSKEIVEDGASGFILPAETGPIERALSRLLDDEELRSKMGARGRRTIEDRFTVQKMGEEFLKVYESFADK